MPVLICEFSNIYEFWRKKKYSELSVGWKSKLYSKFTTQVHNPKCVPNCTNGFSLLTILENIIDFDLGVCFERSLWNGTFHADNSAFLTHYMYTSTENRYTEIIWCGWFLVLVWGYLKHEKILNIWMIYLKVIVILFYREWGCFWWCLFLMISPLPGWFLGRLLYDFYSAVAV